MRSFMLLCAMALAIWTGCSRRHVPTVKQDGKLVFLVDGPGTRTVHDPGSVVCLLQDPKGSLDDKALEIWGDTYKSAHMARVVNQLRALGKDKCLEVLRNYLTNGGDNDKVIVICRLLFVNPQGWTPPGLGEPRPAVDTNLLDQYPLFPTALSGRVPFLLVAGYRLGGLPEAASGCLKQCEQYTMVGEDYPTTGHEKAAQALTESRTFRDLYQARDLPDMVDLIMKQAQEKPGDK